MGFQAGLRVFKGLGKFTRAAACPRRIPAIFRPADGRFRPRFR